MNTIILVHPQIPQNTGNIVRTCSVTGSKLILVHPLGFDTSDRALKRAGLDYWEGVDVQEVDDLQPLLEERKATGLPFYFFSSHSSTLYTDADYGDGAWLIFGSETSGLPETYLERWPEHFVTLPMQAGARCLNLASCTTAALYEAWRQQGFSQAS